MKNDNFCILLGAGGPNCWVIHCLEKDYKVGVYKIVPENDPNAFAYDFYHLDDTGKMRYEAHELPGYMTGKGLTDEDCDAVARWYVLERCGLPDLRYGFPYLNIECGPEPDVDKLLEAYFRFKNTLKITEAVTLQNADPNQFE